MLSVPQSTAALAGLHGSPLWSRGGGALLPYPVGPRSVGSSSAFRRGVGPGVGRPARRSPGASFFRDVDVRGKLRGVQIPYVGVAHFQGSHA